jgi:hypothetical protein
LNFADPEGIVLLVVIAVELGSSIQLRCAHLEGIEATIDKGELSQPAYERCDPKCTAQNLPSEELTGLVLPVPDYAGIGSEERGNWA